MVGNVAFQVQWRTYEGALQACCGCRRLRGPGAAFRTKRHKRSERPKKPKRIGVGCSRDADALVVEKVRFVLLIDEQGRPDSDDDWTWDSLKRSRRLPGLRIFSGAPRPLVLCLSTAGRVAPSWSRISKNGKGKEKNLRLIFLCCIKAGRAIEKRQAAGSRKNAWVRIIRKRPLSSRSTPRMGSLNPRRPPQFLFFAISRTPGESSYNALF